MVSKKLTPRIIIHGGAGNVNRSTLTPEAHAIYKSALLDILAESHALLVRPEATALDVATHAVHLLENNPLFNAGHGAVFTTSGTHELEASVMVSKGYRKRGVGVMLVDRVKNPILLAKEMLIRGEEANGGGAGGHAQLAGETVHKLAEQWGLEMVKPGYYWTKKRWDEHRRGLGKSTDESTYLKKKRAADRTIGDGVASTDGKDSDQLVVDSAAPDDPSWDGRAYLPQGTVGCVVMDSNGTLCAATSTGGLTNKLPKRIGDTPTIGAGFFAEQWTEAAAQPQTHQSRMMYQPRHSPPAAALMNGDVSSVLRDCLPSLTTYIPILSPSPSTSTFTSMPLLTNTFFTSEKPSYPRSRAVAISGTGNGDSFLRTSAARTAASMVRFSSSPSSSFSLAQALKQVVGRGGLLQESAGDRWGRTGEGEGGMIGIELLASSGEGKVCWDLNCGGMFRAYVDDEGRHVMGAFWDE